MSLRLDPFQRIVNVQWGGAIELAAFSHVASAIFTQVNAAALTISGWWRLVPASPSFGAALLTLRDRNIGFSGIEQDFLAFDTETSPPFRLFQWLDSVGTVGSLDLASGTIPAIGTETWAHIAVAMRPSTLTVLMRVNGAAVSVDFAGTTPIDFPINRVLVSSYYASDSEPSRPTQRMGVADLQIWNQYIDIGVAANLANLYQSGKRVGMDVAKAAFGDPLLAYSGGATGFLRNRGRQTDADLAQGLGTATTITAPEMVEAA